MPRKTATNKIIKGKIESKDSLSEDLSGALQKIKGKKIPPLKIEVSRMGKFIKEIDEAVASKGTPLNLTPNWDKGTSYLNLKQSDQVDALLYAANASSGNRFSFHAANNIPKTITTIQAFDNISADCVHITMQGSLNISDAHQFNFSFYPVAGWDIDSLRDPLYSPVNNQYYTGGTAQYFLFDNRIGARLFALRIIGPIEEAIVLFESDSKQSTTGFGLDLDGKEFDGSIRGAMVSVFKPHGLGVDDQTRLQNALFVKLKALHVPIPNYFFNTAYPLHNPVIQAAVSAFVLGMIPLTRQSERVVFGLPDDPAAKLLSKENQAEPAEIAIFKRLKDQLKPDADIEQVKQLIKDMIPVLNPDLIRNATGVIVNDKKLPRLPPNFYWANVVAGIYMIAYRNQIENTTEGNYENFLDVLGAFAGDLTDPAWHDFLADQAGKLKGVALIVDVLADIIKKKAPPPKPPDPPDPPDDLPF